MVFSVDDLLTAINLLFAVLIFVVGLWAYKDKKSRLALYVGLAFGLFAITHMLTFIGMAEVLAPAIIVLRLVAYVTIFMSVVNLALTDIYPVHVKRADSITKTSTGLDVSASMDPAVVQKILRRAKGAKKGVKPRRSRKN